MWSWWIRVAHPNLLTQRVAGVGIDYVGVDQQKWARKHAK